jgi:hypothetical protein
VPMKVMPSMKLPICSVAVANSPFPPAASGNRLPGRRLS